MIFRYFSGWDEHKRLDAVGALELGLQRLQMLDDGNGVGERLARAGLRLDEAVLAGHHGRYGLLLDERHCGQLEALLEAVDQVSAQIEARERVRREQALFDNTLCFGAFCCLF